MENGGGPADGTVAGDPRVTACYPGLKKKEGSEIKRTRGQHFIPAIGLAFRITIVFIFLTDTLIQLALATAVHSGPKPVDTKISGDIIPVGIKASDNDHLAEALQKQGQ